MSDINYKDYAEIFSLVLKFYCHGLFSEEQFKVAFDLIYSSVISLED